MTDLTGKTALVTGSVQGIGLAMAKSFAAAGARLAVHGLADPELAQAAMAEVSAAGATETRFFDADMRDVAAIKAMMFEIEAWGGTYILGNNAGIQKTISLADADAATWDAILGVNLSGAFHTTRLPKPQLSSRKFRPAPPPTAATEQPGSPIFSPKSNHRAAPPIHPKSAL